MKVSQEFTYWLSTLSNAGVFVTVLLNTEGSRTIRGSLRGFDAERGHLKLYNRVKNRITVIPITKLKGVKAGETYRELSW